MKIGDEVYVHGFIDEIRNDVIIIRNEGGYFGTVPSEVVEKDKTLQNLTKPYKSDLISRKDAIDAVHSSYDRILDFKSTGKTVADSIEDIITELPSAQPEIIHCKDCKHFNDGDCEELPKIVSETDFCSFAERKEK